MNDCGCDGLGTLGIDPDTHERLWCDCPAGRKAHLESLKREIDNAGQWLHDHAIVYPGLAHLVRGKMERHITEYDELKDLHVAHLAVELGLARKERA